MSVFVCVNVYICVLCVRVHVCMRVCFYVVCMCVQVRVGVTDCVCMLKYVSAHASVFMCAYEYKCVYECI